MHVTWSKSYNMSKNLNLLPGNSRNFLLSNYNELFVVCKQVSTGKICLCFKNSFKCQIFSQMIKERKHSHDFLRHLHLSLCIFFTSFFSMPSIFWIIRILAPRGKQKKWNNSYLIKNFVILNILKYCVKSCQNDEDIDFLCLRKFSSFFWWNVIKLLRNYERLDDTQKPNATSNKSSASFQNIFENPQEYCTIEKLINNFYSTLGDVLSSDDRNWFYVIIKTQLHVVSVEHRFECCECWNIILNFFSSCHPSIIHRRIDTWTIT